MFRKRRVYQSTSTCDHPDLHPVSYRYPPPPQRKRERESALFSMDVLKLTQIDAFKNVQNTAVTSPRINNLALLSAPCIVKHATHVYKIFPRKAHGPNLQKYAIDTVHWLQTAKTSPKHFKTQRTQSIRAKNKGAVTAAGPRHARPDMRAKHQLSPKTLKNVAPTKAALK